jgi:DNA-binding NarL/FixJ family response regulator
LPPKASASEIRAALEAAAAGLVVLPNIQEAATKPQQDSLLTSREKEVLQLLAQGVGNKEIAWRLKITEHTVKFHVSSLMVKLAAGSRTEAVTQGIRRGYVTL